MVFGMSGSISIIEWIPIKDRLPNDREQFDSWVFLVANFDDYWADTASFIDGKWDNGQGKVIPTHWAILPEPPKQ